MKNAAFVGTPLSDLSLPTTLSVVFEGEKEARDTKVVWIGDYDAAKAGEYVLTASFQDPSIRYDGDMPSVTVTLEAPKAQEEAKFVAESPASGNAGSESSSKSAESSVGAGKEEKAFEQEPEEILPLAVTPLPASMMKLKSFKITDSKSGTWDKDKDDSPGNDSSTNNDKVLSLDNIVYFTSYSVVIDPFEANGVVKTGKYCFEAVLPCSKDIASWDLSGMSWLDNSQITETTNSQILRGQVSFNGNQAAPRIGSLEWVINVNSVTNGQRVPAPMFSMWLNDSKKPANALTATGRDMYVSAAPRYNVQLCHEGVDLAGNHAWSIAVQLKTESLEKGMRGLTVPNDTLAFDIKLSDGQKLVGYKRNNKQETGTKIQAHEFGKRAPFDDGDQTLKQTFNTVYDGGKVTMTPTSTGIQVKLSKIRVPEKFYSSFVTHNAGKSNPYQAIDYNKGTYNFASIYFTTTPAKAPKPGDKKEPTASVARTTLPGLSKEEVLIDMYKSDDIDRYSIITPVPTQTGTSVGPWISYGVANINQKSGVKSITNNKGTSQMDVGQRFRFNVDVVYGNYYGKDVGLPVSDQMFFKFSGKAFDVVDDPNYDEIFVSSSTRDYTSSAGPRVYDEAPVTPNSVQVQYVTLKNGANWGTSTQSAEAHMRNARFSSDKYNVYNSISELKASKNICVGFLIKTSYPSYKYRNAYHSTHYTLPALQVRDSAILDENGKLLTYERVNERVYVGVCDLTDIYIRPNKNATTGKTKGTAARYSAFYEKTPSGKYASLYQDKNEVGILQVNLSTEDGLKDLKCGYDKTKYTADPSERFLETHKGNCRVTSSTAGLYSGSSIKINAYAPYINKEISQRTQKDTDFNVFRVDRGQRCVDYRINAGITGGKSAEYTDKLTIKDVIPKGMHPIDDSVAGNTTANIEKRWGIGYGGVAVQDASTNGGAGVKWEDENTTNTVGGSMTAAGVWKKMIADTSNWVSEVPNPSYALTETANEDGTTTLTWTVDKMPLGYALPSIHYRARIGTPDNISTDIKNGQSFTNTATVTALNYPAILNSSSTLKAVKVSGGVISKKPIKEVITDSDTPIGFKITTSTNANKTVSSSNKIYTIDVLPYKGDANGSTDPGNYKLCNVSLEGRLTKTTSAPTLKLYYSTANSDKLSELLAQYPNFNSIDLNSSLWEKPIEITVDVNNTIQNSSAVSRSLEGKKVTAIAFKGEIGNDSSFTLQYEYAYEKQEEREAAIKDMHLLNTAYLQVDNSVLQQTHSTAEIVPGAVKKVTLGSEAGDDQNAVGTTAGKELTYSISYTNHYDHAVNVDISDSVPKDTTFVSATGNPEKAPAVGETGDIEWKGINLQSGKTATVTFTVKINEDAPAGTVIENTATIDPEHHPKFNTNTTTTPVDPKKVTLGNVGGANAKNDNLVATNAGESLTYTLSYRNESDKAITVTIKDSTPKDTTFVSATGNPTTQPAAGTTGAVEWKDIPLAAGETATVTFTVKVDETAPAGTVIENVGTIHPSNGPEYETNTTENPTDPKKVTLGNESGANDNLVATNAGKNLTYTLSYRNATKEAVTVTIKDSTPKDTTFVSATQNPTKAPNVGSTGEIEWKDIKLAAGETATVTFTVKIDENVPAGTVVENVGTIDPSNRPSFKTNTTENPVDPKKVTLGNESGSNDNLVATNAGENLTYTLAYRNTTKDAVTVTIRDSVPKDTTFVKATQNPTTAPNAGGTGEIEWKDIKLAAGETATVAFTVKIDENAPAGTVIENIGSIHPSNRPSFDTNPTETPTDPKKVTLGDESGSNDNLIATNAGKSLTYTLSYRNTTKEAVTVTIKDSTPKDTTFVKATQNPAKAPQVGKIGEIEWKDIKLAAGETATVTFTVKIDETAPAGTVIENTGTIDPSNHPSFTTNTTENPVDPKKVTLGDESGSNDNLVATNAGKNLTYTLSYRNTTRDDVTVTIKDSVPKDTTFVKATQNPTKAPQPGKTGEIHWENIQLAAGETATVTFTVKIDENAPAGAVIENIGSIHPSNRPSFDTNPTETPTDPKKVTLGNESGSNDNLIATNAGESLTYTLSYRNESNKDITVTIKDSTPKDTTFVSATGNPTAQPGVGKTGEVKWENISLAAGETATVTFTVKIDESIPAGTIIENVGTIHPSNGPEFKTNTTENPTDPKKVTLGDESGANDNLVAANAGENLTYTLTYHNLGDEAATVTIKDSVPADTTFVSATGSPAVVPQVGQTGEIEWKDVPVEAGAMATVTFTVKIDETAPAGTIVENKGTIQPSNRPSFDTNTTENPVDPKKVTLGEESGANDNLIATNAGKNLTYTLSYRNTTDEEVTVTIKDSVPKDTTFVSATGSPSTAPEVGQTGELKWENIALKPGETATVTFTVKIDENAPAGTIVENTGTIDPSNRPTFTTNTTENPVDPKKVTLGEESGANDNLIATNAGKSLTYTLAYRNTTKEAVTVTIKDSVPADTTFVSATGSPTTAPEAGQTGELEWKDIQLAAGETATVTFTVKIDENAPAGTVIENIGSIHPSNRPSFDTNPTENPVDPKKVTLGDESGSNDNLIATNAGKSLTYTLSYRNTTDEEVTVTIKDSVPKDTTFVSATGDPTTAPEAGKTGELEWKDIKLGAGETATVTFTVKIDETAPAGTIIENTGTIDPSNRPTFTTNTTENPVDPKKVTIGEESGSNDNLVAANAGKSLTYTLAYRNTTDEEVTVTIKDSVPADTTFVSATGEPTTAPEVGQTGELEWKDIKLGAGETATVTFTVKIDETAPAGTVIENTGSIDPSNRPTFTTNTTENPVDPKKVTLGEEGGKDARDDNLVAANAGKELTYTLFYRNTSDEEVTVAIKDMTPEHTTFVKATENPATAPEAGQTGEIEWKDIKLAAGETATVAFTVKIDEDAPAGVTVENTGTIDPSNRPSFTTNTTENPVDPKKVTIGGESGSNDNQIAANAGELLTYTLSYRNQSEEDITVTIKDATPRDTTFVSASGEPAVVPEAGMTGEIEWKEIELKPGETATVTFTVKIDETAPAGTVIENTGSIDPSNGPSFKTTTTENPISPKKVTIGAASGSDDNLIATNAGSLLTYTLYYRNTTKDAITVTIKDATPQDTTFVSASGEPTTAPEAGMTGEIEWKEIPLEPGEIATVTFTVKIDETAPAGTVIENVGSINPSDRPSFTTNKTENPVDPKKVTLGEEGGIEAKDDHLVATNAGETLTYTLSYRNTAKEAVSVTIGDMTPENTTFVSATGTPNVMPQVGKTGKIEWKLELGAGETATVTFTVKIDENAPAGTIVENTGTIAPSNRPAFSTNTTENPVDPKKVTIGDKSGSNDNLKAANAGELLTYTLSYRNQSQEPIEVSISDDIPENTVFVSATGNPTTAPEAGKRGAIEWSSVTVEPGKTLTVTFTVRIDRNAPAAVIIENTGTIAPAGKPAFKTNTVYTPTTEGSITVKKTVEGQGDRGRSWTFTVTFGADGVYPYTGSKSGTLKSGDTFTLKHGQSITIKGLPGGMSYEVKEKEANKDGYTTTAKNVKGVTTDGATSVEFINRKLVTPKTGDTIKMGLLVSIIAIAAGALYWVTKKRKDAER